MRRRVCSYPLLAEVGALMKSRTGRQDLRWSLVFGSTAENIWKRATLLAQRAWSGGGGGGEGGGLLLGTPPCWLTDF